MIDLHICKDDKVVGDVIRTYNRWFSPEKNPFLVLNKSPIGFDYSQYSNVEQLEKPFCHCLFLYRKMRAADRIHLHGLFSFEIIVLLALSPKLAQKSNWFIMGDDLYRAVRKNKSLTGRLHMFFRRRAIKKIGMISTNITGDYELAKKYYGCNSTFFKVYPGNANLEIYVNIPVASKRPDEAVCILLGNSATETNHHMEALDQLKKYRHENIRIYAPLSYGNQEYANRVEHYGKQLFGEKFVAMRGFLERQKYMEFLSSIDVAVFAHDRQQAVGNIMPLLYMGKKVYISNQITTWDYLFTESNIRVYPYEDIEGLSFEEFCKAWHDIELQKKAIKVLFDKDRAKYCRKKTLISAE